jgi:hypothetical protein
VESQGKRPEDRKTQNSGGGRPGPVELQPKILAPEKKDQGPAEYTGGPRKQPEDGKFGRGNDRGPRNRDDERYEARNRREQPSSSFKGGYNDSYAEKGRQKDRKRGQDDYYDEYDDNLGYEDEGRGYEDDYYEGDGGYGQDDYYEEYEPHDKNSYYPSEKSSYNRNYGQGSDRKGYDNYDKPSYDDQRGKGYYGQNAKKNFEGGFQEKPGTETGKKVFYQRVDGPQDDTASRKSDVSKRTDTSSYYDIEDDLGFERNNDKRPNNRGDRAKDNGYGRGKGGSEYAQSRSNNSGGHQAQGNGRGREDQRDRGRNNFEQRASERVEDGFKKSRAQEPRQDKPHAKKPTRSEQIVDSFQKKEERLDVGVKQTKPELSEPYESAEVYDDQYDEEFGAGSEFGGKDYSGGTPIVLMVAEKPSIASSIAHALSGGKSASRKGTLWLD